MGKILQHIANIIATAAGIIWLIDRFTGPQAGPGQGSGAPMSWNSWWATPWAKAFILSLIMAIMIALIRRRLKNKRSTTSLLAVDESDYKSSEGRLHAMIALQNTRPMTRRRQSDCVLR